jgi:hypothetical protein
MCLSCTYLIGVYFIGMRLRDIMGVYLKYLIDKHLMGSYVIGRHLISKHLVTYKPPQRTLKSQAIPPNIENALRWTTPSRSHSSWPMYHTSNDVGAEAVQSVSTLLMCDCLHTFLITH